MNIVWREVTRNCHVGRLDGVPVVIVVRPQKHRRDGTKHDWRVEVLGSAHWNKTFMQNDPRDLESTKSSGEARAKWAIKCLYAAVQAKEKT